MHYRRLRVYGEIDPPGLRTSHTDPEEAFADLTEWQGECLVWTGCLTDSGYGILTAGTRVRAHRYAWTRAGNPDPGDSFVDHVCHNRRCVNIDHLRLASLAQNASNRSGPLPGSSSARRGVTLHSDGKWVARSGGRYIGLFDDLDDAANAASAARLEMYGEYAGKG